MKRKTPSEPEQAQYRIQFRTDADITPVEKYFMATSSEQALEMFAYSFRNSTESPELLDLSKWNRWTNEWVLEIAKETAQGQLQALLEQPEPSSTERDVAKNPALEKKKQLLQEELTKDEDLYNDPYYYVRGKPNPRYGQEINRIKKLLDKY